ncbi:MAG: hypothetical protein ACQEP0_05130 [Natrinema limicola]
MKEYPDFRADGRPAFLEEKYGTPKEFFSQCIQYADIDLESADIDQLASDYPGFGSLFKATGKELEDTFAKAVDPNQQEVLTELRITVERHLVFENVQQVRQKVVNDIIEPKFEDLPRDIDDIVVGSNPGDVIDPFLVALNQQLLTSGETEELVRNIITHKCLMKFEDLMGHLHEHTLGRAGGCEWIPEPSGDKKYEYDPVENPYLGADARREESEFFEIKNKTGSEKGSGGEKIGKQMKKLGEVYDGSERYYTSVIGQTLKGHRSKGAAEREDPELEVLVGLTTIQKIGLHKNTPRVLLEFYLELFSEAAEKSDFDIDDVVEHVTEQWKKRYGADDPLEGILYWSIVGDPRQQTNETYDAYRDTVSKDSDQTTLEKYVPDLG